ncbi:hypothetical protein AWV80_02990 [Cupriavidus sp. UYMU48A]|nr:hypothetical protein AWV80_02990 [Cupriavidus sp. UYMU48A]
MVPECLPVDFFDVWAWSSMVAPVPELMSVAAGALRVPGPSMGAGGALGFGAFGETGACCPKAGMQSAPPRTSAAVTRVRFMLVSSSRQRTDCGAGAMAGTADIAASGQFAVVARPPQRRSAAASCTGSARTQIKSAAVVAVDAFIVRAAG